MEAAVAQFLADWGVQGAVIIVLGWYIWRLELNRMKEHEQCRAGYEKQFDILIQVTKENTSVLNELKGIIKTISNE